MVSYADTSFVLSLYLSESGSPKAVAVARNLKTPLPVTFLLLLEFRNALNLAVRQKRIDLAQRNQLWRTFEADLAEGIFSPVSVSIAEMNRKARELSDRHTPILGTRSLDLLHVATALTLGAREMLTFDERQRQAAQEEGLRVRP